MLGQLAAATYHLWVLQARKNERTLVELYSLGSLAVLVQICTLRNLKIVLEKGFLQSLKLPEIHRKLRGQWKISTTSAYLDIKINY